jgi:hypothetical protein
MKHLVVPLAILATVGVYAWFSLHADRRMNSYVRLPSLLGMGAASIDALLGPCTKVATAEGIERRHYVDYARDISVRLLCGVCFEATHEWLNAHPSDKVDPLLLVGIDPATVKRTEETPALVTWEGGGIVVTAMRNGGRWGWVSVSGRSE